MHQRHLSYYRTRNSCCRNEPVAPFSSHNTDTSNLSLSDRFVLYEMSNKGSDRPGCDKLRVQKKRYSTRKSGDRTPLRSPPRTVPQLRVRFSALFSGSELDRNLLRRAAEGKPVGAFDPQARYRLVVFTVEHHVVPHFIGGTIGRTDSLGE